MNEPKKTVTFTIDGKSITVPKGTTVYNAAKQLNIEIPIFCYQDRMPPFGACRMCLVEVEKMPKLQTSCTLEAAEGMVVKTQTQMAVEGREGILEFLLINHPLDCPICDRGGECPLQDNTMMAGPGKSRFYEEKRHFQKPIPLGPVLMLDRERCIICARCTRFSDLVSGDHALEFIVRGYKTEVGTPDGGPAESKFIGNTIMICPVGALTSEVYRFKARPWDNKPTHSTCTLCPVGCSMFLDERDGQIVRTRSCENRDVNDIWLCDKGWFGYEFTYHPNRLLKPMVRRNGTLEPASWEEAFFLIASKLREAIPSGQLAGFGGDTLTVEENYLFQQLMRQVAKTNHVDHRIGTPIMNQQEEGVPPGMEMAIGECEQLSFAILCGLDLTEEFPVIWLRLRQAINSGATVIFLGNYTPEIAKYFSQTILHAPGQELETLSKYLPELDKYLKSDKKGALFVGRQYLANKQRKAILAELLRYRRPGLSLNLMEAHGNSMGARLAGMHPEFGPLGRSVTSPGLNTIQVLEQAKKGWRYLHVAGADPAARLPSKLWDEARAKMEFLVVQDLFLTETARQADVVLPTLCFTEKEGRFLNIESRVQLLRPGKDIPDDVYSDADIFVLLAQELGESISIDKEFWQKINEKQVPISRPDHLVKEHTPLQTSPKDTLAATFATVLFDHGVRMKHNPHLVQMSKSPRARLHPEEGSKRHLQDGATVQLQAGDNTISAKIKFDTSVAPGTIVLPLGFEQLATKNLAPNLINGLPATIRLKDEG